VVHNFTSIGANEIITVCVCDSQIEYNPSNFIVFLAASSCFTTLDVPCVCNKFYIENLTLVSAKIYYKTCSQDHTVISSIIVAPGQSDTICACVDSLIYNVVPGLTITDQGDCTTTTTSTTTTIAPHDCMFNGGGAVCVEDIPTTTTTIPIVQRMGVLDRFDLQGEGGYPWNTFNFVDRGIMYVSEKYANSCYPSVIGGSPASPSAYYTTYSYTTTISGTTYYGLQNLLRFSFGNQNKSAIFRDGRVFWNGSTKIHPWIEANINEFKDLFMPSSYRTNYVQLVLMNNGELRKLDLNNASEENDPPLVVGTDNTVFPSVTKVLNDVTRIVKINQGHNSDCIVACADDSVWHVVIANGHYVPAGEIAAQRIGNLNASEIQFAMIGDPGDSCYVVLKDNLQQIYRLNNTGRDNWSFSWLTERSLTPVDLNPFVYYNSNSTVLLEPGECFIDGSSNEFHYTFLTNKYVHCFKARQYAGYPGQAPLYVKHTLTQNQQPALRMITSTSYAMTVELADGYYLLSSNGIANYETALSSGEYYKAYQHMDKFEDWTNLANYLGPLRGIIPFDPADAILCQ
jgi:hypothetical protein